MLKNYPEVICFVAHDTMVRESYFHCYKVVVRLSETYTTLLDGITLHNVVDDMPDSTVNHVCRQPGTTALVYMIDIESRVGQAIRARLGEQPYVDLTALLATPELLELLAGGVQAMERHLPTFANDVLLALLPTLRLLPVPVLDNRVHQIIDFIETNIDRTLVLQKVAEAVNLSNERTRHLFKEQVGVPFTQFVLWKRIKAVVRAVLEEDVELVQAIHQYGFFDQSHFNRVFKRMFGTRATYFLKQNPYIRLV